MKTLAALYCEQRHVRPEDFSRHVLRCCLYPWARRLSFLLSRRPDYFAPDLELIAATGRLTRAAGFPAEVAEFQYHPDNLGRFRREWKLRLSVTRLQQIVDATLPEDSSAAAESFAPFAYDRAPEKSGPSAQPLAS